MLAILCHLRKTVGKKAAEKWQKDWPQLVTPQMMSLLAATGTRMLLTGDDRARFVVQAFAEAIGCLEKQVKGYSNVKEELRTTVDEATGVAKATKNSLIKFYNARVPCKCLQAEKEEEKPKKPKKEEFGQCSFVGCGEKKLLSRLSACAGCQTVTYCCVDCQRNDWPEHSKDCQRLALEYQQRLEEEMGEEFDDEEEEEEDEEEYTDEEGSEEYDSEYDSEEEGSEFDEYDDSGFEDSDEEEDSEEEDRKKKKKDKKKKEKEGKSDKSSKKDKSSSKKSSKVEKSSKKDKDKKKDKKKSKTKAAQV